MKQGKNLCPVGFLWRGDGIGLAAMVTGLVGILLVIVVKISARLFFHETLALKEPLAVCIFLWLFGKSVSIAKSLMSGAQKRTRTSTKSNFTRT